MANEDKGKVETFDQSDLMGLKPFSSIGPDREDTTNDESKIVSKLKKKKADSLRADGATQEEDDKANAAGSVATAIGKFSNNR